MRAAPKWTPDQKSGAPVPKVFEQKEPKLLKIVWGPDIEEEDVNWFWYPYIPQGKLIIIEGDPGLGKSWVTCAIAKILTCGEAFPDQHPDSACPPQRVLMASAEDGMRDTVKPRLRRLGVRIENVAVLDELFTLDPEGLTRLETTIIDAGIGVVIIDPLVAFLGAKMDMNKANEVRAVMNGLKEIAEDTNTSIIVVRHLRKAGGKALYAGMGSIDFTASARSVLSFVETKSGVTMIKHIKCNLAPTGRAIGYDLGEVREHNHAGRVTFEQVRPFAWTTISDTDLDDNAVERDKRDQKAEEALFDLLRDGAQSASDSMKALIAAGHSATSIRAAKKGLGVESSKNGKGGWFWTLEVNIT